MAYWLLKTEPSTFSWEDMERNGVEPWDGVRNHQAAANLKAMRVGDKAFFYHSVTQKAIVGIVEIVREAYIDPSDINSKFVCVDVKTLCPVPQPITLTAMKADERFHDFVLLRQSRLSVMPVNMQQWHWLCTMGQVDKV
jgi:predicted RNA-binding protein with PUA-like domain